VPQTGTNGDNPPWDDWVAWRARCASDPRAHKAWLAAAKGTLDEAGKALLPKGLTRGKARDWLEATLASVGLDPVERTS
jgi:hypothetical protein